MTKFFNLWSQSAETSVGLFWMAFWAFGLGYLVSSMIQVFVTEKKMKESMGKHGAKSVGLGTFFGFVSSSCSFAAPSTTRALFAKGAGLIPSLAFLLASTNLVIELGIVISIYLGWQFVLGEYLGGVLMILLMMAIVKLTRSKNLEKHSRKVAKEQENSTHDREENPDWKKLIKSKKGWLRVSHKYLMEWKMVWKDILVGFTVAGVIAVFVPQKFFQSLFIGAGNSSPAFYEILLQSLFAPIAAFFTFIGSMGNIPLAAVLWGNGVSFAGIMAFIFSDLVVFPVLRIQTKYYGWKMAAYILGVFLVILVSTSLIMHYGFEAFGLLPDQPKTASVVDREFFKVDYTLYLNALFLLMTSAPIFRKLFNSQDKYSDSQGHGSKPLSEKILGFVSVVASLWLLGGLGIRAFI